MYNLSWLRRSRGKNCGFAPCKVDRKEQTEKEVIHGPRREQICDITQVGARKGKAITTSVTEIYQHLVVRRIPGMPRQCTTVIIDKQLSREDPSQVVSEWKNRLQLLEGEKKANYETGEEEKKKNAALIDKLKKDLVALKDQKARVGKNEPLMRCALEGNATGSSAHQHIEPREVIDTKNDRLGDLTNQLNKLRAKTAKKRLKLTSLMTTFKEAVVDNIVYEENRQPDEVRVRQLNNQIDCVSKKLLEAEHMRDKYGRVVASLRNEQMTYTTRLELMGDRIREAIESRATVLESQQYAKSVQLSAHHKLSDSQHLSSQSRQERDSVLDGFKQQAEEQRAEYAHLRRQLFVTGGPENALQTEVSGPHLMARRVSQLVDAELAGHYSKTKELLTTLGVRSIEDAVKLFEMQADTSRQLDMVWKDSEANIQQLRKRKQEADIDLEHIRYADNVEEARIRERCRQLKETIASNLSLKKMCETNTDQLIDTLGGVRAGLIHMIEMLGDAGISVLKLTVSDRMTPPALGDLFGAVTAAVKYVTQNMVTVNVEHMMDEIENESFVASKSQQLALEGKIRGVVPIQIPEKKRFSFLLVDSPGVIDEGPTVMTRAQMKRQSQIMIEARARKVRAPTTREQRRGRRRSTIIDRTAQAMF